MRSFATLVDKLYFTNSNLVKTKLIKSFLQDTPDPDRGWAISAIAGTLDFQFFKRKMIKDLATERIDPVLFEMSYDYVGEMSETVSHLWCELEDDPPPLPQIPSLSDIINTFKSGNQKQNAGFLTQLLNKMDATQRWALLKLGTKGLRIGVSARFLKKALAEYGKENNPDVTLEAIERLWHAVEPPYTDMFNWLDGKGTLPDVSDRVVFQPVMLAHPADDKVLESITPDKYRAEWKFDGIRIQLAVSKGGKALYSRTGDDISHSFPDIVDHVNIKDTLGVFDGELVAIKNVTTVSQTPMQSAASEIVSDDTAQRILKRDTRFEIGSFNQLQQRLNKKKPSKKLISAYPVGIILYDCLFLQELDLRNLPLDDRMHHLSFWYQQQSLPFLFLSQEVSFNSIHDLRETRADAAQQEAHFIEGVMLKHRESNYVAGRPKGNWYKWKRDPLLIDAVIMYAQRGHGIRSSFYSDFTLGCWQGEQLLPVCKAYSGFTDEELKSLDKWVRKNTIGRFGPVKDVNKALVCEIAFDSIHQSNRHKSGVAMRFPRIHRIRWDKPANEADTLDNLMQLVSY
ncbi:MAG: cisplatin damage response ATP-dependent DNA ligase [Pseudomonadota bacterium]